MKSLLAPFGLALLLASLAGCATPKSTARPRTYTPDDPALYAVIVQLDSTFFAAYNTCEVNLDKYAAFYADSVEFYHDKGGLMTSKPAIVAATKRNICGKVTRQLVRGSVEVYPIRGFGAVEIGFHTFHNAEEPTAPSVPGRFVILWQHRGTAWKIKRVVSLH